MTRWPAALATLAAVGILAAGCGGGEATPTPPAKVPRLAPAADLGTPLPSGWPAVTLPEGSSVTDTAEDGGRLEVDFESQQLANAIAAFLDQQLVAAGFQRGARSTQSDTLTANYASGPLTAQVTLVETAGTTSGTVVVTDPSATASTSPAGKSTGSS